MQKWSHDSRATFHVHSQPRDPFFFSGNPQEPRGSRRLRQERCLKRMGKESTPGKISSFTPAMGFPWVFMGFPLGFHRVSLGFHWVSFGVPGVSGLAFGKAKPKWQRKFGLGGQSTRSAVSNTVQWCSGALFPLFFGGCPTKNGPKKGFPFFSGSLNN